MAKVVSDVVEERIKIFAINKKYKEKPFLVTAVTDVNLKKFVTGQEHLTAAELAKSELVIKPEDNYMIRNNDEFILRRVGDKYDLTRDYALYCLLQVVPEVAPSRSEAIQGTHLFYLENYEKEAKEKVSLSKMRAKAYAKVADVASLVDMVDMLFYFGETAASVSSSRAEAKIYELVEARADEVVKYFDNAEASRKLVFVKKLLYYNIIKKQSNGYLMYGDIVLGANDKEASVFIFDNKNEKVYIPLEDQLKKSILA